MPLIELKTYKPVCDVCGKAAGTWTNVESGEESKVAPDGWLQGSSEALRLYLLPRRAVRPSRDPQLYLVCDTCQEIAPEPLIRPENDSRA